MISDQELSQSCVPYFISETGLSKSDYDSFVNKVKSDLKEEFEDQYTFINQ